ncbi:ARM repeat-containing protein [Jaminaea rosea]|uniref:ARM repeat-containing protein n=1 Tax=Jaminaea rosea TaxID=1569628 RepID=A0A316UX59_9BASI|nr:ARM repeat-containing protein [Jaminaea rosea]PWN29554.1 ARM repeat-containing protein [Jaminaea rosea]
MHSSSHAHPQQQDMTNGAGPVAAVVGGTSNPKLALERDRKRIALRQRNLATWQDGPSPPSGSLDSNMKKNTGFIKRVRQGLGVDAKPQLIKETATLNLDKYVEELTQAIPEGLSKCTLAKDCIAAAEIVTELHARFDPPVFAQPLAVALSSALAPPNKAQLQAMQAEQKEREEANRVSRQKVMLRIAAELALVEVIRARDGSSTQELPGQDWLFHILRDLLSTDREHVNVPILITLLKALGPQLVGRPSEDPEAGEAAHEELILPPATSAKFRKLCETYFTTLSKRIVTEHQRLQEQDRKNHEAYIKSGDIFEDRQQRYEKMTKSFERVNENGKALSELLGVAMPQLTDLGRASDIGLAVNLDSRSTLANDRSDEDFATGKSPWEDEDTKRFYEDIVDLRDMVPASILGSVAATAAAKETTEQPQEEESKVAESQEMEPSQSDEGASKTPVALSPTLTPAKTDAEGAADEQISAGPAAQLSALLARLPEQTNRTMIDSAAVDFAFLNSKAARRRLVKHLTSIPRNRLDLIPYYARLIATLHPHMPDVGKGVLEILDDEFRYLQRKRLAEMGETRAKNARFIAELTKFRVTPLHTIFHCFKVCLDDFSSFNIEILATLLETCGRFLLRIEATTERMRGLLELLRRKRMVSNLDHRNVLLLDNAYYQCNPPEGKAVVAKPRSHLELYVRHLIYDVLTRKTFERVLKMLRKLPWSDEEVLTTLHEVFLRVWRVKYGHVHLLALLLADLQPHHPDFVIAVIDAVIEETRLGMETNLFKHNQRRMAIVLYLGQLYIYRLVNSGIVFDQLWSFVTFGHPNGQPLPGQVCNLDAPDDFFRLRLACTLLDTCGACFNKGSLRKRLDEYLAFLNLYVLSKEQPLPMDIDFMLQDTIEAVRPGWVLKKDWAEAAQAVNDIMAAHRAAQPAAAATATPGGGKKMEAEIEEEAEDDDSSSDDDDASGSESGTRARGGRARRLSGSEHGDGSSTSSSDEEQTDDDGEEATLDDDEVEEDLVIRRSQQSEEDREAEQEFERELAKMMAETNVASNTGGGTNRGVAHHGRGIFDQGLPFIKKAAREESGNESSPATQDGQMRFELLSKRGNKHQAHTLHLPSDSAIAVTTREKQLQELQERRQLKEYVLGYEGREDEEERRELEKSLGRRGFAVRHAK